jgi:hypothetical protein
MKDPLTRMAEDCDPACVKSKNKMDKMAAPGHRRVLWVVWDGKGL